MPVALERPSSVTLGREEKVSQMERPRPSAVGEPSTWAEAGGGLVKLESYS